MRLTLEVWHAQDSVLYSLPPTHHYTTLFYSDSNFRVSSPRNNDLCTHACRSKNKNQTALFSHLRRTSPHHNTPPFFFRKSNVLLLHAEPAGTEAVTRSQTLRNLRHGTPHENDTTRHVMAVRACMDTHARTHART